MPNVEETQIFFNAFTGEVRKIFNEDKDKYLVLSWIIFNTNYSDEYKELKRNQCYFSFSMVESSCNIKRKKLQRIMKELENEGFIEWIFRSNSKGKESILGLKKGYGSEYGSGYGSGYGSDSVNTSVEVSKDTVQNTVQDTVQDTLSKKQSKKQNNIYSSQSSEEYKLAILLRDLILKRDDRAKCRNAKIENWAKHIDLLHRIDNRTYEEIESVIRWAQSHKFWSSNILSTKKLRDQFPTLYIQMNQNNPKQEEKKEQEIDYNSYIQA